MPASSILRTSPTGNEDQAMIDDLALAGIRVEQISRNRTHLIVIAYGSHEQPLVAIVLRCRGEQTAAYARLMTRNA